jgi:hypothetical protein
MQHSDVQRGIEPVYHPLGYVHASRGGGEGGGGGS